MFWIHCFVLRQGRRVRCVGCFVEDSATLGGLCDLRVWRERRLLGQRRARRTCIYGNVLNGHESLRLIGANYVFGGGFLLDALSSL